MPPTPKHNLDGARARGYGLFVDIDGVGTTSESERAPLYGLPVNLVLSGRTVLVVGGGRVATRKVDSFLDVGALVEVVAPEVSDTLAAYARTGRIEWTQRRFLRSDVDRAYFICAATGDPNVEHQVFESAERARRFANAADVPEACSATLMALHRDRDLIVAVGSNGRSPAVAKAVRDSIAEHLAHNAGEVLDVVAAERDAVRSNGQSSETVDWQPIIETARQRSAIPER